MQEYKCDLDDWSRLMHWLLENCDRVWRGSGLFEEAAGALRLNQEMVTRMIRTNRLAQCSFHVPATMPGAKVVRDLPMAKVPYYTIDKGHVEEGLVFLDKAMIDGKW